jgi:hypothetical protein
VLWQFLLIGATKGNHPFPSQSKVSVFVVDLKSVPKPYEDVKISELAW